MDSSVSVKPVAIAEVLPFKLRAEARLPEERRWHPAARAATMIGLGAMAWIAIVAAGRLIAS